MSDVAEKLGRWKLLRYAAMIAVVAPAMLFAGCAEQQPPPPQPVAYQPPSPPPGPPPAPAPGRVIGERG